MPRRKGADLIMANDIEVSLQGTLRDATTRGKGPVKRLHRAGLIPAVIYGKGAEPVVLSLDPSALRKALQGPRKFNTVLTVKLSDGQERLALIKSYQQHPVTRNVIHVDFIEVQLDQPVTVEVPVVLVGKADGVIQGGMLTQVRRTTSLLCLPRAIPVQISHDVTALKVNQTVHESDLILEEGVRLANPAIDETIAVLTPPEVVETPAEAAQAKGKK